MKSFYYVLVLPILAVGSISMSYSRNGIIDPLVPERPELAQRRSWSTHAHSVTVDRPLELVSCKIKDQYEASNRPLRVQAAMQFDHRSATSPEYHWLTSVKDDQARFYCEQSLWDAAPYMEPFINAHGKIFFKPSDAASCHHDCAKIFFNAHPELKGRVVVTHVISPAVCTFFPEAFTDADIHQINNLRALLVKNVDSPKLQSFRKAWPVYISERTNEREVTRKEIVEYGNHLLARYESLFEISARAERVPISRR